MRPFRGSSLLLAAALWTGCAEPALPPVRGIVLISIDTLRADHLGAYGYARDTSPFLDELAARGVLFERAVAQYPNTLTSHMSLLTGLYPAEHGVFPPDGVLSPSIPTLAELLAAAGWRTAGFVEDGYVNGEYGFERGFSRWHDEVGRYLPTQIEQTLERGVSFLREMAETRETGETEPFFLFLHTYAVHDPYDPPEPFASRYWQGPRPEGAFHPAGPELLAFNRRQGELSEAARRWLVARYDGSIRYADSVLRGFFAELDRLGLTDEVAVVVTSDHGEEFLEHGRLAHTQVYDETLHVPLLVIHPGVTPRRVPALVQGIDLFPTLLELAGVGVPEHASGRSLVPHLRGGGPPSRAHAYAETDQGRVRTLYRQAEGELLQLVDARLAATFARRARFDLPAGEGLFELKALGRPRRARVAVDGVPFRELTLAPGWTPIRLPGERRRRVEVSVDSCEPADGGRCRGFQVSPPSLRRLELFALDADPAAEEDLSRRRERVARRMLRRLEEYERQPLAESGEQELSSEQIERLRALGYL